MIRTAQAAGMFYPAGPHRLREEIGLMLSITEPEIKPERVVGIVCPHAGYIYSGKTAAYAYNCLKGLNVDTVIIISPSHREYFAGTSIYNGDAYETPLGAVPVNNFISDELSKDSKTIFRGVEGHRQEHAIEVQIPFLQSVLNNFSIVPVVIGDQGKIFVDELAERLSKVIDDKTIIVASSDLSHYYPSTEANRLDSVVEERINKFDFNSLQKDLETGKCEACGGGAIVALMKSSALQNKKHALVLYRNDSSETSGDTSQVVGYLSAVVYGD
jgi:MEMO1 family protein